MSMTERVVVDDALGTLTWNHDLDWWEGKTVLAPDMPLRFSFSVEQDDPDDNPAIEIQHTRRVLDFLREHEPEARLVASEELREIYNDQWNAGSPLSETEFMERLTLDDVHVAFDGSAELYYRDEGLFAGHAVLVTLDARNNLQDADIAG